jgi:hypothetical protein
MYFLLFSIVVSSMSWSGFLLRLLHRHCRKVYQLHNLGVLLNRYLQLDSLHLTSSLMNFSRLSLDDETISLSLIEIPSVSIRLNLLSFKIVVEPSFLHLKKKSLAADCPRLHVRGFQQLKRFAYKYHYL